MKIKSKTFIGQEPVYDISVDSQHHDFQLENGVVVSNCFNKAHSVSYSMLTYVTGYLKANYPVEFFTALMTTRSKTLQPKTWAVKAPEYIKEAKHFNVDIYPPDINKSGFEFTIHDNEIYFGLNAIRDVGGTAAKYIITARGETSFKDVWDFIGRVNTQKVNTKTFEALVKAGAFDKLGYNRAELLVNIPNIYNYVNGTIEYHQRQQEIQERNRLNEEILPKIERRNDLRKRVLKLEKQFIKTNDLEIKSQYELSKAELEELESLELKKLVELKSKELPVKCELVRSNKVELELKEILDQANFIGCYIGGHPMQFTAIEHDDLDNLEEHFNHRVAGVILSIRHINTKTGKKMAVLEIDDSTGSAELVVFPQKYELFSKLEFVEGDIIISDVKVDAIEPDIKLIANRIYKHIWDEKHDETVDTTRRKDDNSIDFVVENDERDGRHLFETIF